MKNEKVYRMVYTALLVSLMVVMHFTFGYITTTGLEICFMMIPVVIGAVILGPVAGMILGGCFGLSSFLTCLGIGHPSAFGATLFGIQPFYAFIMCFVPRLLMGLLVGIVFRALSRCLKNKTVTTLIAGFCGALFNTLFFMSALILLFGQTPYIRGIAESIGAANSIFAFVVGMVGINGLIEAGVCLVVSVGLSRALMLMRSNHIKEI